MHCTEPPCQQQPAAAGGVTVLLQQQKQWWRHSSSSRCGSPGMHVSFLIGRLVKLAGKLHCVITQVMAIP